MGYDLTSVEDTTTEIYLQSADKKKL